MGLQSFFKAFRRGYYDSLGLDPDGYDKQKAQSTDLPLPPPPPPQPRVEVEVQLSTVGANPGSRPKEFRDYVEYVLSTEIYQSIPEEHLKHWEDRALQVVLPPEEWQIEGKRGQVVIDGDWQWDLQAKSEAEWQLYAYTVKGFPELLKVGIAKDVLKRKEKYYGRCKKKWVMPRREAILVERLFMHATYGLAHTEPPHWNVGNHQEDTLLPELAAFYESYPTDQFSGQTEVRKIDWEMTQATIEQIIQDVRWQLRVDELLLKYAIKTFDGQTASPGRNAVKVPHLRWQLQPYESQHALTFEHVEDETVRALCVETEQEDEEAIRRECWDPSLIKPVML